MMHMEKNKLQIRKAKIEDLNALINLRKEHFLYEKNELGNELLDFNWVSSEDSRNDFKYFILKQIIFIAEVDNNPVGYICGEIDIKKPWYKENIAILTNLFVKEKYRRKNIGKYLLDYFIDSVKEHRLNKIEVCTRYNNNIAINFYEKNGFKDFSKQLIIDI